MSEQAAEAGIAEEVAGMSEQAAEAGIAEDVAGLLV
jgi:hypothetical protein